ncbi:MAG TPA: DinB family protein [Flavisolibacter sp.]|jgi:uncharacterized damage-inducible protein DinB|nr:DinB family protein [Flavisolibacter sp.]
MAKFKSEDLIRDLKEDVEKLIAAAEHIKSGDKNKLVYQLDKKKWSIVQILEHLNAYGRYYIPVMEKEINGSKAGRNAWFETGFWGNYFTNSMKPTNVYEIRNKMKAMKAYTFPNSLNVDQVLKEYIDQKRQLLELLDKSKNTNLNAIKIPITLTKLIRLKLGDALRFLIAHEQRHMVQARNTMKTIGITTDKFPVILQAVPQ